MVKALILLIVVGFVAFMLLNKNRSVLNDSPLDTITDSFSDITGLFTGRVINGLNSDNEQGFSSPSGGSANFLVE